MSNILTPGSNDERQRLYAKIAALEKRIAALERDSFSAPVTEGAPTNGGEGALAGDSTNTRLWIKINGVWRYAALT